MGKVCSFSRFLEKAVVYSGCRRQSGRRRNNQNDVNNSYLLALLANAYQPSYTGPSAAEVDAMLAKIAACNAEVGAMLAAAGITLGND